MNNEDLKEKIEKIKRKHYSGIVSDDFKMVFGVINELIDVVNTLNKKNNTSDVKVKGELVKV